MTERKGLSRSAAPFPLIRDHVLLGVAAALPEADADADLAPRLTEPVLRGIVGLIPDEWLAADAPFAGPAEHREAYLQYLLRRLQAPRRFVEEAVNARARL